MARPDYFGILEQLSKCALEAVRISCVCSNEKERKKLFELRKECDAVICSLEETLFSDFIPPLQRDNIAAYAHAFSKVIDRALDLSSGEMKALSFSSASKVRDMKDGRAACILLAEKLFDATAMLRSLRSPSSTPDLSDFRNTLREGREANLIALEKVRYGALPSSRASLIYETERLRCSLSSCFDKLIEIMLNNI